MRVSAAVSNMQHTAAVPGSTSMQGEVAADSVLEGGYSDGSSTTEDTHTHAHTHTHTHTHTH